MVKTALFPITLDGERLGVKHNPPRRGEHTAEVLSAVGMTQAEIGALFNGNAVA